MADPVADALPVTVIRPRRGWAGLGLGELWGYRELLWFMALRDVRVRYKQTLLGAAWALIQPLATMLVFWVFFSRVAGIRTEGVDYRVFVFAGLVPWYYFSTALTHAADSVVANRGMITKVYFPRLVLPLVPVLSGLADFLVSFVALLLLNAAFGIRPPWTSLATPLFLLLAMATALAGGLWIAAFNAKYRDFRYTIPFLINLLLFASPIAYPSAMIRNPTWRALYGLNPVAGVVEGFRWALVGTPPPGPMLAVSAGAVLLLLLGGLEVFRRMERSFVDVV